MKNKFNSNFFVHDSSYVDDHCVIGNNTKIWHFSHIQSGAMIGDYCSIAHHAVLHSAEIGDHSLIGIHATVMDGVVIGQNCIVAGGAFLTEGTVIPDNSVVMGMPGKVVRNQNSFLKTKRNAMIYHRNALAYACADHRAWTGPEFDAWNRKVGRDLKAEYRALFDVKN